MLVSYHKTRQDKCHNPQELNLPPVLKQHPLKIYGSKPAHILNLSFNRDEWTISCSGIFTPGERAAGHETEWGLSPLLCDPNDNT
jgi:hypothetical protein